MMWNLDGLWKKLFSTQTDYTVFDDETQTLFVLADPEYEGVVTQKITPRRAGQIGYRGSWWTARCRQDITLYPGDVVYVVDRQHVLTLYVEPDPFSLKTENLQETAVTDAATQQAVCQAIEAMR